jgi:acyl carrier protein
MDRAHVINQVHEVLSEGFEIDPIKLMAHAHLYHDLGIDSLDAIDMLVLLEEKLGRPVDATQFKNVRLLSDIYGVIERMMAPESAADLVPVAPQMSDATP